VRVRYWLTGSALKKWTTMNVGSSAFLRIVRIRQVVTTSYNEILM
jgi:hypothetical protein